MTRNELIKSYFNWMYELVNSNKRYSKKPTYKKLLRYLNSIDFQYTIPMDANRAEDGVDLRYRFAYEYDYDERLIAEYLDNHPCSVLEMLVALSLRCEEHIMDDPDVGDRIGQWFWTMIVNLELGSMHDDNFDEMYVDEIIDRFHDHLYGPRGEGGLFFVENPQRDMRNVEIWYQMCWYLNEIG